LIGCDIDVACKCRRYSRLGWYPTLSAICKCLYFSLFLGSAAGSTPGSKRRSTLHGFLILYVLVSVEEMSLPLIMLLVCLLSVLVTSPRGVIVTYINERFVTDVRATGFGAAYSLSVIIPSFYAFYMAWLGEFIPFRITPVLLLCIGGVIAMIGAAMGPETRAEISKCE
jgi:hypothetical protein